MPVFAGSSGAELLQVGVAPLLPTGVAWHILGEGGNDTILGFAADTTPDTLEGGSGSDSIVGNRGRNLIRGDGQGIFGPFNDDTLDGGIGDDTLFGGVGADRLFGGKGDDLLNGEDHDDVLDGGKGNDRLFGGSLEDTLLGGRGNDELDGGTADDLLVGGKGRDALTGGDGKDSFAYAAKSEGGDLILDFTPGLDVIQLSRSGFGLASAIGAGISAADWGAFGTAAAFDASGLKLGYVGPDNDLYYDANGAAAGGLVLLARFSGGGPAGAADYAIVA